MKSPAKLLLKRLVLLVCILTATPAAKAQAWPDGNSAPNTMPMRHASLPATRYGLLAPGAATGNLPNTKSVGYSLPSGGLPYSSTSAMSISICDDEPVMPMEEPTLFDDSGSVNYYPAQLTPSAVRQRVTHR